MAEKNDFIIDKETDDLLDQLKDTFGVTSKAQVIRKALALAKVSAANTDNQDTLTIKKADGQELKILLKE